MNSSLVTTTVADGFLQALPGFDSPADRWVVKRILPVQGEMERQGCTRRVEHWPSGTAHLQPANLLT